MQKLREQILELEIKLSVKKNKLFKKRLECIVNTTNLQNANIKYINIQSCAEKQEWCITYTHKTYITNEHIYDIDYYLSGDYNETKSLEENVTKISFGKRNKYFIESNSVKDRFDIYKNGSGEMRIINLEYEFLLDLDEQRKLMEFYSKNYNVPEWFAIAILLFIEKNDWDDEAFINYISIV